MARVAIIGGGISGMCSAYLLADRHDVALFEAGAYLGGHTHTHSISRPDGNWNVDTGFIVYNNKTYPSFIKLLKRLNIEGQPTTMSFSVRSDTEDVEYNGTSMRTLFAQNRNIVRPAFWRMIRGIIAFNRDCKALLMGPPVTTTLGSFLGSGSYSREFADWYIRPMAAAVWSTGTGSILDMPIYFLARFFENHGFLNIEDRPQWCTVKGGSSSYANAIAKHLGSRVRLNSAIVSVDRSPSEVILNTRAGVKEKFDHVIVACHSDSALKLLSEPTPTEQKILGAIRWSKNKILLHTDESVLPKRRLAWAAWNYYLSGESGTPSNNAVVTYHMNLLQGHKAKESLLVSLNSAHMIRADKILKSITYHHPIFDRSSTQAQAEWNTICGPQSRTQFAGAYWFNGFHEDGVQSALRAVQAIDGECVL
ncbi:MAG: FAD-dependent oxidoreductase [Proteobacteria bacterium]|nr:FAD-dependent oxidoreductase [Pseudomonadota bacterium]